MESMHDLVVIGAGAAGLGAAQYAARANLEVLVLEEMAHGGQALLIDRLENYPGLPEPVDGYTWSETMRSQAETFGAAFSSTSVNSVKKSGEHFEISTTDGPLLAKAVILATGAKHRHAGVKGEEEFGGRGVSYCATCDGPFFKGKAMVVIGGGDAACDEAMYLAKIASEVTMIHRKDRFRAQKALADRVLSNPKIKVIWDTVAEEIRGEKSVQGITIRNLKTNELSNLDCSAVFVFVGSIPQTGAMPAELQLDETGYIVANDRMETSIPGLYAVGDVRTTPFRQVITAVADGAVAAHCAAQYIDELEGHAYQ
ncbi:MAG: thioredoxin-disulfide reductase [Spirochaetes bacterium]|nr:thioredoxin-disulfide reductase [Spirochaetota bacterium]MBU0956059.1 thioredoxin-disulfide reductase [Spirochaetota bacterium]